MTTLNFYPTIRFKWISAILEKKGKKGRKMITLTSKNGFHIVKWRDIEFKTPSLNEALWFIRYIREEKWKESND